MTVIKNGISITSNEETIRNIDGPYPTRYAAEKDRRTNPYIRSDSVIVSASTLVRWFEDGELKRKEET